jgi:hypothetical protein
MGKVSESHESFREHIGGEASSDRAFGLTVGSVILAIGIYRWLLGEAGLDWLTALLLIIGALLAGLGWLAARHLAPLNRLWARLGLLLFKVISPVIVFAIFALAVVPIGMLMRARGRDPLRLRKDRELKSYWIERRPPGPAPESMIEQF